MDNNNLKRNKNKTPYFIGIFLALLLVGFITVSTYAYFTATVSGNSTSTVLKTASIAIEYSDGPKVGLSNAIPGTYIEKTFTVKNIGTSPTYYDVFMADLINTFADRTDLVYTLTSNDGGQNITTSEVPPISTRIVTSKAIGIGQTHTYTLRINFLETNDNQDDNKGCTFSTTIRLNEII